MTLTLKVKRITETEDFSDITKQSMEKLIKLRDRRKQNWLEMQKAASEEYRLMWEVEKEIDRRLGLLVYDFSIRSIDDNKI